MRKVAYGAFLCLLSASVCGAATITVDDNGPADFDNIRAAVIAANPGDTVLVADGVYRGAGNRDIDFQGKSITVRSASGAAGCIIDCEGQGRGFYFNSIETAEAVVEGFTITGGRGNSYGGAIYCRNSASPTVNNCVMRGNYASYGGGAVYLEDRSAATFTGCEIVENMAESYAGGLYCSGYAEPVISNCVFRGNESGYSGGGLYFGYFCNAVIDECVVRENISGNDGGGFYCGNDSLVSVSNSVVSDNVCSDEGGGFYCYRAIVEMTNCVVTGNHASDRGGAVYSNYAGPTVTNCTFVGNSADAGNDGGGIYFRYNPAPTISNCIFAGNSQHAIVRYYSADYPIVENCLFHGNPDGDYYDYESYQTYTGAGQINGLANASNNLDAEPLFAFARDYHIVKNSPCIDRGTNNPAGGLPERDRDGNPRPLAGSEFGLLVADIGAYEYNYLEPTIALSTDNLEFVKEQGGANPEDQVLEILNCGGDVLNWEIDEDCAWLSVTPKTGQSTTSTSQAVVRVDTVRMARGIYRASLTVSSPDAANSPRTVWVTLRIKGRLYVPDQYPTIQAAIDDAMEGETIEVGAGVYNERVALDKQIELLGVGRPVIDVNGIGGTVVTVDADNCTVDGFEIRNGSAGVHVAASGNIVSNNLIAENMFGVRVVGGSNGNSLSGNEIVGSGQVGLIISYAPENMFRDNSISGSPVNFQIDAKTAEEYTQDIDISNTVDGKPIYYLVGMDDVFLDPASNAGCVVAVECSDIIIEGLTFSNNAYGVVFAYTGYSVVEDCVITNNSIAGVMLYESVENGITDNVISGNQAGIVMMGSGGTYMRRNMLEGNAWGIDCAGGADDFVHNADTSNTIDGRPLVYLVDKISEVVDANSNAACVFAVRCRDITVSDLVLSGNGVGVTFVDTSYSRIQNVTCEWNRTAGIFMLGSSDNTVWRSYVCDNPTGVWLDGSDGCAFNADVVCRNRQGILCRDSELAMAHSIVRGNSPNGGVYISGNSMVSIANCTIFGNARGEYTQYVYPEGGGISSESGQPVTVTNSIIWANSPEQIAQEYYFEISYSDIQGGFANPDAKGIIDVDPLLTGDGHLRAGSPCINMGDPTPRYSGYDIDGEFRVYGPRIDLGADEFSDTDGDRLPDGFEKEYFDPNGVAAEPGDDPDGDGHTNIEEYEWYASDPTVACTRYYVDGEQADNIGDGLSWETAKKTIGAGVDLADDSDVVMVAPGYYGEGIRPQGRQIVVQGRDAEDALAVAATIVRGTAYFGSGEMQGCTIRGLTISAPDESAVFCRSSAPTIDNCVLLGSRTYSSAMGGGITCMGASPLITDCIINGNVGYYRGSAIYATGSSIAVRRCVMAGNCGRYSGDPGNAIYLMDSALDMEQCTVADSQYPDGYGNGSAIHCERSDLRVSNSILWNEMDMQISTDQYSTVAISYSDVRGGAAGIQSVNGWAGTGNIAVDPCFVSTGRWTRQPNYSDAYWIDGDYHLRTAGWRWTPYISHGSHWVWDGVTSICIDAGNPGTDLGEEAVWVPVDPDSLWGENVRVNMGGYGGTKEAGMAPPGWSVLGDLSNDGMADFADLARCTGEGPAAAGDHPGDLDRNGVVNVLDLALFTEDWLGQSEWRGMVTPFEGEVTGSPPPQGGTGGGGGVR